MSTPIAALGHVGIRKEESFASGGAVDSWQPFDTEDIQLTVVNIYGDRIQATAESVGGTPSHRTVAGPITFGISPQNPSQWWYCGLGQSSSPYSIERPLKSLLIQIDRETGAVQASGCTIGSMAFSSSEGEELKCTVNIEAKDMGNVAAGNPTFTSGDAPYIHSEATFLLNGVTDTNVKSFSVNVDNGAGTDLFGSNQTRIDIPATKLVITGSYTKLFANTTERNAFLARQVRTFQVTFTRGAYSYDINVNKIRYDTKPTPLAGQSEYIVETFNWTAYVDDADVEKSVVLTVV